MQREGAISFVQLNGSLFVLVGVQIPRAVRQIRAGDLAFGHAVLIALVVVGVVIGTRMAWVFVIGFGSRLFDRRPPRRARRVGWRQLLTNGWAGFRGAVSLAAALAVPTTIAGGAAFPGRDLSFFVTATVILVTILLEGTTLPAVVRWAHLPPDTARAEELRLAQLAVATAAVTALPEVAARVGVEGELLERLQVEYAEGLDAVEAEDGPDPQSDVGRTRAMVREVRLGVLDHQREAVTLLRNANRIDDIVLRELQASLDLEEADLRGPVETE